MKVPAAPFAFHVRIAGTIKPRAGFATLEDAREYGQWASARLPQMQIVVAAFEGTTLYLFRAGKIVDAAG